MDPGDALRSLESEQPPRVFYDGHKGRPVIPLTLRPHVERYDVIDDLLRQVMKIADLVGDCPRTVTIAAGSPTSTGDP